MASPGLEPSSIEEAADQLANGPHENFERLRASIFTSSTKRRIQELQTLQSSITGDGLSAEHESCVLNSLMATVPRYNDRPSQQAIAGCLRVLVRSKYGESHLTDLVTFLQDERKKLSYAPSSFTILVQWCSIILEELTTVHPELWRRQGLHIMEAQADFFEKALASVSQDKLSRQISVLFHNISGIERIARKDEFGMSVIEQGLSMLLAKGGSSKAAYAPFLGQLAGMSRKSPQLESLVHRKAADYIGFFTRELLGSRTPLPYHVSHGLDPFFASSRISAEWFERDLAPIVEKALLRAPEVAFNELLLAVICSLPIGVDLSLSFRNHLLKPILSAVKSSNLTVRDGSLASFEAIILRCADTAVTNNSGDEIMNLLKETKSAELRSIYSQMLKAITSHHCCDEKLLGEIAAIALKETNEHALEAEVKMLCGQMLASFHRGDQPQELLGKAFQSGITDRKASTRRVWALGYGEASWALDPKTSSGPIVCDLLGSVMDSLLSTTAEVVSTQGLATATAAVTTANVAIAVSLSKQTRDNFPKSEYHTQMPIFRNVLGLDGKQSYLTNHRVYTKFTSHYDFLWFVRALTAIAEYSKEAIDLSWAQAITFILTAAAVPTIARKEAKASLRRLCSQRPVLVPNVVISGLWLWLKNVILDEKDTAAALARTGRSRLYQLLKPLSTSPNHLTNSRNDEGDEIIKSRLVRLLVLCRKPLVQRGDWIQQCLRSGIDPKALVSSRPVEFVKELNSHAQDPSSIYGTIVFKSACVAAAELAFIDPENITPLISASFQADLHPRQLANIGPNEAAIFRTPEGTTFFDVLSSKPENQGPEKGHTKDYDVLKWEQELREQVLSKPGQPRRLSPDEQAKIKTELAKEAGIRANVRSVVFNLQRGIGCIVSLAQGPPSDAEVWMGPAIECLMDVITNGAELLLGDAAASAYLSCAEQVTPRLGVLRKFIGVATLRAQGRSQLPSEYETEDLGDLITRMLYRLRFNGEQRPFDVVSFMYILPLLTLVLQRGGIGRPARDEADEQITLAVECLSYHAHLFSGPNLPRKSVLQLLIVSLRNFPQHYRILKDCMLSVAHAIGPNSTTSETEVLLRGCTVPETTVRSCALQAIDNDFDLEEGEFFAEIWLACHESDDDNLALASAIWSENGLCTTKESVTKILPYLHADGLVIRQAAASALAAYLHHHPDHFAETLGRLKATYIEQAKPRVPDRDAYGMLRQTETRDPWESRQGIAFAFQALNPLFSPADLVAFVQFLLSGCALADRDGRVRDAMVKAASTLISQRGQSEVENLMKILETHLEAPDDGVQDYDLVNEATIIMYGALARHLKAGDIRISKVVFRLLRTLETPSETVQYAIAGCLPPLVRTSRSEASDYVQFLLGELFHSKKFANRRGAAYGLAGIVQGCGLSSLREYRILSSLRVATEEKKDPNQRQGAYLAFELLSSILGPVFEPYVIQIVPQLLLGFGDNSPDVREACLDASKTCFRTLSSYGVKETLPTLLSGLNEEAWRSKKGACDSLGAMAYLDPQQLAASLPVIIPPLTNVLTDSHKEVRGAANRSLQRFGDVISNPEIKSLVGILLKALSDPTKHTEEALDALLRVNFIHYLDAPSLALVVRILERGLGDRSQTKRKASQVIGSLAHLSERKDILPHLPILVSGLRVAVVDPVPSTRATASKALGSLVEKLGEDALPDLVPSLMATLKTDTGAGDRLGSAQALSEVLAGLGITRLEETLPSILQNVSSAKESVREGFMSLFIFLPACFGNSFANYLSRIIPPILAGLADDLESIRETSLRAGRLLVKNFATKAIDLLLPELQRGLADDSHRIRLSSVELVGDLLFNLTGITTKLDPDEFEDTAASAGQSLLDVLGEDKRNHILSALYISRCDTSGLVRTAAINVWKALVATPRTLRDITPTLTQAIIRRLASSNMEQKIIASNALGELIRKAGDGVLASLLPTLEEGLETSVDIDAKQGICIALRELISSASEETLEDFEPKIISIIRTALVDGNSEVREAAAEAFDSMQRMFGKKVVDQILPHLLGLLQDSDNAENALAALLTLLTEQTRANAILPILLPILLASPISVFNANAIASLASVAGSTITRRLKYIIEALMDSIVVCRDDKCRKALETALDEVLLSVDEFDGLNTMMSLMLGLAKHDDHRKRQTAAYHFATFCSKAEVDYSRYYADLVRIFLNSFDDRDEGVVRAAYTALNTLTSNLRKEDMESLVISTRQSLRQVGVPGHNLAGFLLPKGINAILPIFLQGLINGTAEQRTHSALAISELIDKTSGESLKPFVTQITGPLIRVVSERSVDVKAAILQTLNNLLEKIPTFVKPFLPQLQRTFTKALADTSSEVLRSRAAKALGTLITLTPRIDPLIGELVSGSRAPDPNVKAAMQKALFEVVNKVGTNMSEASRGAIIALIDEESRALDDTIAVTHARLLGAMIKNLSSDVAGSWIETRVIPSHVSIASVLALNAILLDSPETLTKSFSNETVIAIARGISSSSMAICDNAVLAAGKYLLTDSSNKSFEAMRTIFEAMALAIHPGQSTDSRRLALVVIRTVSREKHEIVRPHIPLLAQPIFYSVRDPVIPVKLSAEAAFMALFKVVDEENSVFDKYIAGAGALLPPTIKRPMQDYFKRVALRLGVQARERKEAEGGQYGLGLSNDEKEDERELWSVGQVVLEETSCDV